MILCFPGFPCSTQCWRASLSAASVASVPLVRKKNFRKSPTDSAAISVASASTASLVNETPVT